MENQAFSKLEKQLIWLRGVCDRTFFFSLKIFSFVYHLPGSFPSSPILLQSCEKPRLASRNKWKELYTVKGFSRKNPIALHFHIKWDPSYPRVVFKGLSAASWDSGIADKSLSDALSLQKLTLQLDTMPAVHLPESTHWTQTVTSWFIIFSAFRIQLQIAQTSVSE